MHFESLHFLLTFKGCSFSLQDCLKVCASNDHIYLPPSRHTIRVLEPLNSGGLFTAIYSEENNKIEFDCKLLESNEKPILATDESDNVFLSFNGDYTIENLILDCRQVRIGIWVKAGTVTFKNCRLIGDHKSSTGVGIAIAGKFLMLVLYRFDIIHDFFTPFHSLCFLA